ncbi:hypothetical protein SLU01_15580 [Sporosarcina luteola]|uniref:Lysozyme inhibitor LprI-like N-terminal domain-containing protein n=1 Tax=Sporosarcina luteola TaxID=582850 RepID=A0A511Z720_9BACL|nr:lysozyme inhibitor LprI family protein [Sporosarcina luteola]GEN83246.1 hypothetical protein SLU01_15580 [Sporosarcina luteola]
MKNHRKLLVGMLAIILVIVGACGNTSDETQNNDSLTPSTGNDDAGNHIDPITNTTAGFKKEYHKKLADTNKEVNEIRKKYADDSSTYAMKKVEGDRYDLWDELLNEIYGVLKEQLSTEEMDQLRDEQRSWIKQRDNAAKEASLKFEGGTAEQLEYIVVLANLTEERCYELVETYMD